MNNIMTIRVPKSVQIKLKNIAASQDITRNKLVNIIIAEYVKEKEIEMQGILHD